VYCVRYAGNCLSLRLYGRRRRGEVAVGAGHAADERRRSARGRRCRRSEAVRRGVGSGAETGARRLEDADVDDGHDGQRDVERPGRAVEHETAVVGQLTLLGLSVVQRVLAASAAVPADQRRNRYDGAGRPDDGDLYEHTPTGPLHGVRDGVVDGVVAIQRDGAQMQDRRRARQDVERQPGVAPDGAERPPALDKVGHVERHDEYGDRQIGAGQRRDEEVGNRLERSVREDRQDDQDVT